jgi:hypothetical protein
VLTVRVVWSMKLSVLGLVLSGSLLLPAATSGASERRRVQFDCSVEGGTKQVAALLAAFSSGQESRVRELISRPTPRRDGLELAPTFAAFAKGPGAASTSNLQVHTKAQLRAFMRAIGGHTFKVVRSSGGTGTNMQTGPGAWTGPAVVLGVAWRARGDGPGMKGHEYVSGDSKILVVCPSGKIRRALFSPNAFGPTPQSLSVRPEAQTP